MNNTQGVYFIANDGILDLAIAFLNSFRTHNPDVALCLIPFNDQCARVSELAEAYCFEVFSDLDVLRRCDRISVAFHGRIMGHYRKLAIWEGPFEEFVYVDCDTVVLGSFDPVFGLLGAHDFLTAHSDLESHRKWVWKESVYDTGALSNEQIAYSANTGLLCSRKDALRLHQIEAGLDQALCLAPHMQLLCTEQPFLNYLIVTSGRSRSSLQSVALQDPSRRIPMVYPPDHKFITATGKLLSNKLPPPLLVHWAGCWYLTRSERRLASMLMKLRIWKETPALRFFLPNKRLWTYYREQSVPAIDVTIRR